jgi:hypothetical protein
VTNGHQINCKSNTLTVSYRRCKYVILTSVLAFVGQVRPQLWGIVLRMELANAGECFFSREKPQNAREIDADHASMTVNAAAAAAENRVRACASSVAY